MKLELMERIANLVTGMARVAVPRTPRMPLIRKKNQNPKTKII